MEVPSWVCKKIAEIDPNCRLGYAGKFALIKLYRCRDTERFAYQANEWKGRGPIFNKSGGRTPDWDLIERVPCNVADLSATIIFNGDIIQTLKEWTSDWRDVQRDNLLSLIAEDERTHTEKSEEMVDYARWHNRHSYKIGEVGASPIIARKFMNKEKVAKFHGDRPSNSRYRGELDMLETKWRKEGWVPREERHA